MESLRADDFNFKEVIPDIIDIAAIKRLARNEK
jgi:hypothetical protein